MGTVWFTLSHTHRYRETSDVSLGLIPTLGCSQLQFDLQTANIKQPQRRLHSKHSCSQTSWQLFTALRSGCAQERLYEITGKGWAPYIVTGNQIKVEFKVHLLRIFFLSLHPAAHTHLYPQTFQQAARDWISSAIKAIKSVKPLKSQPESVSLIWNPGNQ